jgi:ferrochelatase
MRIAVLMLNLGGPRNLDQVKPFLLNLFRDRETIRFPGGRIGQKIFARLIVALKWRKSAATYAKIGGGSPLVQWTRDQGEGMRKLVEQEYDVRILPLPCMRFWHPYTREALQETLDWRADHVVAFTQYPHLCTSTTGSSLREVNRVATAMRFPIPITEIAQWHDQPTYVQAVGECVRDGVARSKARDPRELLVVYSAHSIPIGVAESGDPYPEQIRECVELVHRYSGLDIDHEVTWQSKVSPIKWLVPSTLERVKALHSEGRRHIVVVPISFTSDHVETLYELDIQVAEVARQSRLGFARSPSLNIRPTFIKALAEILGAHLQELGVRRKRAVS